MKKRYTLNMLGRESRAKYWMHRILAIVAIIVAGLMPANAQDTGDMIYVYQKNGDILPFMRSEIMEFCYSFEDEDSVTHEEPVMQCIVMEDSIIRIPIENIDSVSFVTPATVYQPGVIRLEQGLMDYVESCDSLTILFAANTPAALLPKVGDKLVTLEMNEKFPVGFAGVVSKVSGNIVECNAVGLEEIFKTYYNTTITEGHQGDAARAAAGKTGDGTKITLPTWSMDFGFEFSLKQIVNKDLAVKGGTKFEIALSPEFIVKTSYIVNEKQGTNLHVNIKGDYDLQETVGLYAGLEYAHDFLDKELVEVAVAPLTKFYIKPGMFFKAAVTASLAATMKQHYVSKTDFRFCSKNIGGTTLTNQVKLTSKERDIEATIDGSLALGAFVEVGLTFLSSDIDKLCFRGELGTEVVSHFVLLNSDVVEASKVTKVYEALRNCDLSWNAFATTALQAELGPWGVSKNLPFNLNYNIAKLDFVPTFDKLTFEQCWSPRTAADASMLVKGNCFAERGVGFKVFTEEGEEVGSWEADDKYKKGDKIYGYKFRGLEDDGDYVLQPTVKYGLFTLLANPTVGITKNPFPVRIVSFEQTGSHYSKQKGYEYDGRNYFYKFNATTTVELSEGVGNVKDWGYVYVDFYGEHKKISCANMGTHTYPDVRYAYYYNGPQRTVELYPYVQFEGDSEIQGGKHKIYDVSYDHETTTSCPDGNHPHMIDLGLPSGTLWSCCNIGATEPEDGGEIYEWGCTNPYPQSWYYNEIWNENTYNYGSNDFGYTVKEEDSHYGWSNNQDDYDQYMVYDPDFLKALEDTTITASLDIAGTPYDAATATWGEAWQTPTKDQMQELIDYCVMEPVIDGGDPSNPVHFKFSNNGRYILLPSIGGGHEISTATITANQYEWSPLPVGTTVTKTENHKYYGAYMTSTEVGREAHPWFLSLRYTYNKRQAIRAEGVTPEPVEENTTQKLSDGYQETAVRPVMKKR